LIEDLTLGGERRILVNPSEDGNFGYIETDNGMKKVLFDLSEDKTDNSDAKLESSSINGIRYFAPENIVAIN